MGFWGFGDGTHTTLESPRAWEAAASRSAACRDRDHRSQPVDRAASGVSLTVQTVRVLVAVLPGNRRRRVRLVRSPGAAPVVDEQAALPYHRCTWPRLRQDSARPRGRPAGRPRDRSPAVPARTPRSRRVRPHSPPPRAGTTFESEDLYRLVGPSARIQIEQQRARGGTDVGDAAPGETEIEPGVDAGDSNVRAHSLGEPRQLGRGEVRVEWQARDRVQDAPPNHEVDRSPPEARRSCQEIARWTASPSERQATAVSLVRDAHGVHGRRRAGQRRPARFDNRRGSDSSGSCSTPPLPTGVGRTATSASERTSPFSLTTIAFVDDVP